MVYYSYTLTEQQKNELQIANLTLEVYMLRQSWSDGSMPSKSIKDFMLKPAGTKQRLKKQTQQDMMMNLAIISGINPAEFLNGPDKDRGDSGS